MDEYIVICNRDMSAVSNVVIEPDEEGKPSHRLEFSDPFSAKILSWAEATAIANNHPKDYIAIQVEKNSLLFAILAQSYFRMYSDVLSNLFLRDEREKFGSEICKLFLLDQYVVNSHVRNLIPGIFSSAKTTVDNDSIPHIRFESYLDVILNGYEKATLIKILSGEYGFKRVVIGVDDLSPKQKITLYKLIDSE